MERHEGEHINRRRARWGNIITPMTTVIFLFAFIGAMLLIYFVAR